MAATASFSNWSPYKNYVQSGGAGPGMVDGQFISGQYVGLFAGPPRLASLGSALGPAGIAAAVDTGSASQLVYPIGITQSLQVGQNRQLARIFEIGSERSYFISGRTMGQIGLARTLYHGPSLLRVLYAHYKDEVPDVTTSALLDNPAPVANQHDVVVPPGYQNFYINLASDLFSQPHGLLVIVKDSNLQGYGCFYLESCYIPSHSWSTDAQGVLVQENVGIQYEQIVPIDISAVTTLA